MTAPHSAWRGPLLMIAATALFTVNDTFIKLATGGLPPYQVLAMRGVVAMVLCLVLVAATGAMRALPAVLNRWVVLRSGIDAAATMFYITALAGLPIADVTAIAQVAPMLLILGMAVFYGDRVGPLRLSLVALGCVGALLVAQPTGTAFSPLSILAFCTAVCVALRDVAGRRVPASLPGPVVVFGAIVMVTLSAGAIHFLFETNVSPDPGQIVLVGGAAFFLALGQLFIFLAYRDGATATVAPFYYGFSVWAVLSGLVVFHTLPNALATVGMLLIVASGVSAVIVANRQKRLAITA